MGLLLQIFSIWNGRAWCFRLACLTFIYIYINTYICTCTHTHIYITVISAVFYCERKPQCCSHSRAEVKMWITTVGHFWVFWGNVTLLPPRVKETLGKGLRETISPTSIITNQFQEYHWTCSVDIWDCASHHNLVLSQMDHCEEKLGLSSIHHWDKVLAKYDSN